MKHWTLAKTLIVAAALPVFAGCATRHEVVYTQQPAGQTIIVQHPTEPPAVRMETIPSAPDPSDIWVRGAWDWRTDHWVWIPGHWEQPNVGHEWVPGHWQPVGNGYEWVPGQWR